MTNQYPRGKLSEDDEGVLEIKIAERDNTIIIDFGKPVVWLGMPVDQAESFANLILAECSLTRKKCQ